MIPYEGRYDAQPLGIFGSDGQRLSYVHQSNLIKLDAQVRDIQWIRTASNKNILVVAGNNDRLRFYRNKE